MKLEYNAPSPLGNWSQPTVLVKRHHRIELYIRAVNDAQFALIALSGPDNSLPEKTKNQGPYVTEHQALAAKSAIVNALLNTGYQHQNDKLGQWKIQVQRELNSHRSENNAADADYQFDPKDVFFDTLGLERDEDI